jgi:hypothetical protein
MFCVPYHGRKVLGGEGHESVIKKNIGSFGKKNETSWFSFAQHPVTQK